MPPKQGRIPRKESLKGLKGWNALTDEEFDKKYQAAYFGMQKDEAMQEKIDRLYRQFEEEYDLDEMLPNDRATLKSLVQSMVLLDIYQTQQFNLMKENGTDADVIAKTKVLADQCASLTSSISKMQDDLKISRKVRRSDKEANAISFLEDLKVKGKKFYDQKMTYLICPSCKTILGTVWLLYPQYKSTIVVDCHRELDDGKICGTRVSVNLQDIYKSGSNTPEVLPESMK